MYYSNQGTIYLLWSVMFLKYFDFSFSANIYTVHHSCTHMIVYISSRLIFCNVITIDYIREP